MLSRDCAEIKITQRPHLSKEALLLLASLIASHLDSKGHVHDNLLQTTDDGCKGGRRGEGAALPMDTATRADLIDLMARVLVAVFQRREEESMTEALYSPKIRSEHLARKAIVYLRQSF